jgi:hypothetical protein
VLQVKDVKIKRVLTFVLGAFDRQLEPICVARSLQAQWGVRSDERVIHARTALRVTMVGCEFSV